MLWEGERKSLCLGHVPHRFLALLKFGVTREALPAIPEDSDEN